MVNDDRLLWITCTLTLARHKKRGKETFLPRGKVLKLSRRTRKKAIKGIFVSILGVGIAKKIAFCQVEKQNIIRLYHATC